MNQQLKTQRAHTGSVSVEFNALNHPTLSLRLERVKGRVRRGGYSQEVYRFKDLNEWTAGWWSKRTFQPITQKTGWKCESPPIHCNNAFRVLLTAPPTCHHQVKDVNRPRLFDRARKEKGTWKEGERERQGERLEEREWISAVAWYSQRFPAIKAVDSEPGKLPWRSWQWLWRYPSSTPTHTHTPTHNLN